VDNYLPVDKSVDKYTLYANFFLASMKPMLCNPHGCRLLTAQNTLSTHYTITSESLAYMEVSHIKFD